MGLPLGGHKERKPSRMSPLILLPCFFYKNKATDSESLRISQLFPLSGIPQACTHTYFSYINNTKLPFVIHLNFNTRNWFHLIKRVVDPTQNRFQWKYNSQAGITQTGLTEFWYYTGGSAISSPFLIGSVGIFPWQQKKKCRCMYK